jgi:hypothetical protein
MKCFNYYASNNDECQKKECRYWINSKNFSNCSVAAANSGTKTLQDIGKIYNITRMRVCQIEKKIITKIKKRVAETLSL